MTNIDQTDALVFLDFAISQHSKAQDELALTDRRRRINAVLAVRSGIQKTDVAERLGISRPTLDAWIAKVEATPDEMADVEGTEYVARRTARA